eukprot:Gregarina_sp_Poly_1__6206@NODE_328_length_9480_cov_62_396048_g50_i1_p5_GENE_NODE_328_length_9480_cov_62_396048_g50_i1NODE_328_length_9480_cov_62_396048_g50_i1_p5_ORF_typecomplete_len131_score14_86_NODE_328_length_9480_cov_62_396048_g50_i139894381
MTMMRTVNIDSSDTETETEADLTGGLRGLCCLFICHSPNKNSVDRLTLAMVSHQHIRHHCDIHEGAWEAGSSIHFADGCREGSKKISPVVRCGGLLLHGDRNEKAMKQYFRDSWSAEQSESEQSEAIFPR